MLRYTHLLVQRFVGYFQRRLGARQFLIASSIFVGLTSGLVAVVLKYIVHSIGKLVIFYSNNYEQFFLFSLFPLVGIVLTVFYIRYFLRDDLEKGSSGIVYNIAKKSSLLPASGMYSHFITSALTIGFGGSGGLESPMVSTGSAIGSNYSKTYNLSYKERTILLACGASAGIAAAFNSPIAGVLFAVEVLLADVSIAAFIPLIISAASGALISKIILEEGVVLTFSLQRPFDYRNVPFYIVLGLLAGFLSLYYVRSFTWIESKINDVTSPWVKAVVGGLLLGALLIAFPPLFGEGYETIKSLASGNLASLTQRSFLGDTLEREGNLLLFLGALVFLKSIAAAITIGSGGNGGNFAPSLFVGAYLGFIFARLINLTGLAVLPVVNFTLVAMAGILSGVFYAPLTAIFLIAEITGGYGLMIPLMIVSALSFTVAHYFQPLSMEARKLSTKLKHSVEDRDKYLLSKLDLNNLIETNFLTVKPEYDLQSLITVISQSHRNSFPVINDQQQLVGIVELDDVRHVMFNHEVYSSLWVKDLMSKPKTVISTSETLPDILKKFDESGHWNLPVVENDRYIGFLSKSSILTRYRDELLKLV